MTPRRQSPILDVVSTRSTNCRGKLHSENHARSNQARYARRRKKCRQGRSYHAGTRCSPSRENDKSHQSYSLTRSHLALTPGRWSQPRSIFAQEKKIAYSLSAKNRKTLDLGTRERAMSSRAARLEESGEEWNGDEGKMG